MLPISPEELRKVSPVPRNIALTGPEQFFKDELRSWLSSSVSGFTEYTYASSKSAGARETILRSLNTSSLFSAKRLVYVAEPNELVANNLEDLIAPRSNNNVLLLNLEGLDRRTKAAKTLEQHFQVVDCKVIADQAPPWDRAGPFWETPLAWWIVLRAKAKDLKLTTELGYYITTITGTSLYEACATIDKLILLGRPVVTHEDITALAGASRREGPFRLADCVAECAWDKCLVLLHRTFQNGLLLKEKVEHNGSTIAIILLSRIWSRLRELYAILGGGDAAKKAGVPPFLVGVLLKNATNWPKEKLQRASRMVERAELEAKGLEPGGGSKLLMERLIVSLSTI
jgi:DNA polymerase III delta subunit